MNIKIIIATHKETWMPDDPLYLPLHVGKEGKADIGYIGDNTGDNISLKNPYYSELTGLYWAWKNLDAEYIGLAHYRRHFSLSRKKNINDSILTLAEAQKLCSENDIILPKKRRYYIETLFSHYTHTHDQEHLVITREIIQKLSPEYLGTFDYTMKRRSAHLFNMSIMKKEYLNMYCSWLFPILFELENHIDYKKLPPFEARLFGRISELLIDVWIEQNKLNYKEIKYVHLGKSAMHKKVLGFLLAKICNKKYKKSF